MSACSGAAGQAEASIGIDTAPNNDRPVELERVTGAGVLDEPVIVPVVPAGVEPFSPAEFVQYCGFHHGSSHTEIGALMPETQAAMGERTDNQMAGTAGVKYERHLAVSWRPDNGMIEYVSVRSDAAIEYLEGQNRGDDKLSALWRRSKAEALGILGEPTERVSQPHADAFRYEFEARDGRKGALTLLFSNLQSPPRCSRVSVSWSY